MSFINQKTKQHRTYMVMTANGTKPPSYKHITLPSAQAEAARLSKLYNTTCTILEVVGKVELVDVPVVEKRFVVTTYEPVEEIDDLPF